MTAQLPGFCPTALWVATNGQQVAPLRGSYPFAELQSAYSTAPANRAFLEVKSGYDPRRKKECLTKSLKNIEMIRYLEFALYQSSESRMKKKQFAEDSVSPSAYIS